VNAAIFTSIAYLAGSALFILSLHWMNTPKTARNGVFAGIGGLTFAIVRPLFTPGIENWLYITIAIVLGFVVGVPLSQVPLTAVPQRTALSHAFGGIAAGLVGTAKFYLWLNEAPSELTPFRMTAIILEILLGYPTFTGSLMAAGKLQDAKWILQHPVTSSAEDLTNPLRFLGVDVSPRDPSVLIVTLRDSIIGPDARLFVAARATGGASCGKHEGARSGIRSAKPYDHDPLDGKALYHWACTESVDIKH